MIDPNSIPNDSTGDALRRVISDGSDLSQPMDIDYHVHAPDEASGQSIAKVATSAGFRSKVVFDTDSGTFTVWCTKTMIATHEAISEDESKLDQIARPFEGYIDGWGTFGNAPSA